MVLRKRLVSPLVVVAGLALAACADEAVTRSMGPQQVALDMSAAKGEVEAPIGPAAAELSVMIDELNASLDASGADFRVLKAEYSTSAAGNEAGGTVLGKDVGNKQLADDFVPFDPRRTWSGVSTGSIDNITYAIDQSFDAVPLGGGLTAAQTDAAITRAMNTWEAQTCSALNLTRNFTGNLNIGFLVGLSGPVADVQHAGFRQVNFAPGILGVTFTFVFVQVIPGTPPVQIPTDIDNNGKADVAFREIFYDPSWIWADNGNAASGIDVESVAVHEAGHGLSQAHFGKIWLKNDGSLKASPKAVMNALYAGPYRVLAGTDNGGHCSNWGNWPNN